MTLEEAAKHLGMSLRHLQMLAKSGALQTEPDGTVSEEEFVDFSERRDAANRELQEVFANRDVIRERAIQEIVELLEKDGY